MLFAAHRQECARLNMTRSRHVLVGLAHAATGTLDRAVRAPRRDVRRASAAACSNRSRHARRRGELRDHLPEIPDARIAIGVILILHGASSRRANHFATTGTSRPRHRYRELRRARTLGGRRSLRDARRPGRVLRVCHEFETRASRRSVNGRLHDRHLPAFEAVGPQGEGRDVRTRHRMQVRTVVSIQVSTPRHRRPPAARRVLPASQATASSPSASSAS